MDAKIKSLRMERQCFIDKADEDDDFDDDEDDDTFGFGKLFEDDEDDDSFDDMD